MYVYYDARNNLEACASFKAARQGARCIARNIGDYRIVWRILPDGERKPCAAVSPFGEQWNVFHAVTDDGRAANVQYWKSADEHGRITLCALGTPGYQITLRRDEYTRRGQSLIQVHRNRHYDNQRGASMRDVFWQ